MKKFLAFVMSLALMLILLPTAARAEGHYWTFEDTAIGSLPAGFTTAVLDTATYHAGISMHFPDGVAAAVSTFGGSFGNNIFMGSWFSPAGRANRWLITPALDISDQTDVLRWYAKSADPRLPETYNVLISTTDSQPASFTTTLTSVDSESSTFQRHNVDLSSYSGQTVYIAFQLVSNDRFLLLLDNIGLIASIGSDMLMVNAGVDQSIELGSSASLSASVSGGEAPYSYSWSDGTATVGSTQSITVTPDISTTYTCMVTDAAGTTLADSIDVSVPPAVYTITATPASFDFGSMVQGYAAAPGEQTCTIENIGNQSVTLSAAPNTHYDISSFSSSTLTKTETATFTIRPKTGLSAGTYNETVTVNTDHGTSVDISVSFTVETLLALSPSISSGTVYTGGRITLTPSISGGTWTFDSDYLTRSDNTFTAVKAGQTTVRYDAAGQHTSYVVTIRASELPNTGQDFTWAYLFVCAALLALGTAAFRLRKQPMR